MLEILPVLSLRFRGEAGQECWTGAYWNLNLSSILFVEGCRKGARCGTQQALSMVRIRRRAWDPYFFMMVERLLKIAAGYITAAWLIDGSSDRCI